jgi:hypothetical protein
MALGDGVLQLALLDQRVAGGDLLISQPLQAILFMAAAGHERPPSASGPLSAVIKGPVKHTASGSPQLPNPRAQALRFVRVLMRDSYTESCR